MNLRLLMLTALVLIQFAVPGWMIFSQEQILQHGLVFKFKTAPVDPYDAFRGRYVALQFIAENDINKGCLDVKNHQLWAQLAVDAKGYASVKRTSAEPLSGEDVMIVSSKWGRIHFPFDRYYMDEKLAPKADAAYRDNSRVNHENAYVTVRILNGHAALEELYIDDKPIREFLQTEAPK